MSKSNNFLSLGEVDRFADVRSVKKTVNSSSADVHIHVYTYTDLVWLTENPTPVGQPSPVRISEIKLEIAMLWATVNFLQEKCCQSQQYASIEKKQVTLIRSIGK